MINKITMEVYETTPFLGFITGSSRKDRHYVIFVPIWCLLRVPKWFYLFIEKKQKQERVFDVHPTVPLESNHET